MSDTKTTQQIVEQIKRAVRTARPLPPVFAKPRVPYWPPGLRAFLEAYGFQESQDAPSIEIAPTPGQLAELDEVIWWRMRIQGEIAKIIWARAEGHSWDGIANMAVESPDTCKAIYRTGVYTLAKLYNQPEKRTAWKASNLPVQR